MKMLLEGWFSYKGINCEDMGLRLLKMPARQMPALRASFETASGRDGDLFISDGAFEAFDIAISCETLADFDEAKAHAWLAGAGDLVFSDEQNRACRARVADAVSYENKFLRFDKKLYSITFHVQPFKYMLPAETISISESGQLIENPGNVYALPRVTVTASGTVTVAMGGEMIQLNDVSGGFIIDCEKQEIFDLAGTQFLNASAEVNEFFRLTPGLNRVSYTGEVQGMTIEPRWRCI